MDKQQGPAVIAEGTLLNITWQPGQEGSLGENGYMYASQVAQWIKNPPAIQETWIQSLGLEDPLEERMAMCYSILAWEIPWKEEPGKLHSPWSHKESDTTKQAHTIPSKLCQAERSNNSVVWVWRTKKYLFIREGSYKPFETKIRNYFTYNK